MVYYSLIDVHFLKQLNYLSLKRKRMRKDLLLPPKHWSSSPTTAGTEITRIVLSNPNALSEIAISRSNCLQQPFNLLVQRTMTTFLTSKVYDSAMLSFTDSFAMNHLHANILIR